MGYIYSFLISRKRFIFADASQFIIILGGIGAIWSFANHDFFISWSLFGLATLPIISILSIRYPDVLIFVGLMASFTPFASHYGNIIVVITATIKLFEFIVIKRRKIRFDIVVSAWILIGVLLVLTIPKWHHLSLGLKAANSVFLVPLVVYILFVSECIDYNGIRRFIRVYFPMLAIYLLVQVFGYYILQGITLSSDWRVLHGSSDLEWGRNNTIAAVSILFASLIYCNPVFKGSTFFLKAVRMAMLTFLIALPVIIVSRGAIISFMLALSVYYLMRLYFTKRINVGKIVLSALVSTFFIATIFHKYIYAFIDRVVNLKIDLSTLARLSMIHNTIVIIKNNLIIGVGPEQVQYSDTVSMIHNNPHNIFLQYGAELGIFSIFLIGFILIVPFYRNAALYRISPEKGYFVFLLFAMPMLVAIINSQLEIAITLRGYGLVYWIIYAISVRMINDLKANRIDVNSI